MRKQILEPEAATSQEREGWLPLQNLAAVEVASEDAECPIENVFSLEQPKTWRAARIGVQTIRLTFSKPQVVRKIRLEFTEDAVERSQEFLLQYWTDMDSTPREIVRQQWNFTPTGSRKEVEEYKVDLGAVKALQLTIDPDRGRNQTVATLDRFLVA